MKLTQIALLGLATLGFLLTLSISSCQTETPAEASQEIDNAKQALPRMVQADGSYDTVALEKPEVVLKLIQNSVSHVKTIEEADSIVNSNLKNVKQLVVEACTTGEKPNIILLHEFPLTGYLSGSRSDKVQMAIEIPGAATDELCQLAKQYDTYLIFGSYAVDPEWPGHILSLTSIIDRNGKIINKVWKPRNIKRFYSTFEITTTTVESVRERFVEKYGMAEELPVIKTEYGNIAVSTVQLDPLIYSALAMKGAEIILRTSTLFFESDVVCTAMSNNVYSAMANIPGKSSYAGKSMVVAPNGKVIAQLDSITEGILTAKIPIAKFRKGRKLPQYSVALTQEIFNQYQEEIPNNHMDLPEAELPQDGKAMKQHLDSLSLWMN